MHYELRFQPLFDSGRGYAFPCDAKGRVDLNQLSDRARNNYLFARAVVGRELAAPAVQPIGMRSWDSGTMELFGIDSLAKHVSPASVPSR